MVKATLNFYYSDDHKVALSLISQLCLNEKLGIEIIKTGYDCFYHSIVIKVPFRSAVYSIVEAITANYDLIGTIDLKIRGRDKN